MYGRSSQDVLNMTEYKNERPALRSEGSGPAWPSGQDGETPPAVRDLLVYYARHSTMHGIPSIVGSRLYPGRRVLWCCVVCVMAVLLVTVIYWQMSDFSRYPTVSSVNVHYVTDDDFPAVTICDLNMFNKLLIEHLAQSSPLYMSHVSNISSIFHIVGKKLLEQLHYDFSTDNDDNSTTTSSQAERDRLMVQELVNHTIEMIQITGGGLQCSWGDFYWENCSVGLTPCLTDMGLCFTVDTRQLVKHVALATPKVNVTESAPDAALHEPHHGAGSPARNAFRGLSLVVSSATADVPGRLYRSEGFKVVLHDHREYPLPQSRGFLIGLNSSVEVEIEKHVRIGLERPFRAFGTGPCVDVEKPEFVNPLKRFPFYTKEACETECFIDSVIRICQCRHFLHPGDETTCSLHDLRSCFRQAEVSADGGARLKAQCDCPMPCRQNRYSSGVSYASFRTTAMFDSELNGSLPYGLTSLHLYFPDPIVTTIQQVPVNTLEGLLGSIGGQVGLFMGFSLVTVAELCELALLLCTRSRRLISEETRHVLANNVQGQAR